MIIDELIALLGWETKGEGELNKFKHGLDQVEQRARTVSKAFDTMSIAVGTFIGSLASQAVTQLASTIGSLPGDVIETSAKFEGFQTSLETIEGSAEKAKASMDWITKFAAKTPYELAGVTEAFIKLKSYGIDPMDGTLTTLGDTASAMNKPLNQAVEAFADATNFQFERLREFGVTASQKGEEVTFKWTKNGKTLTKVVKKNGGDIQKFLKEHWGATFNGAMLRQSKTWNGMMSNLGDSWDLFKKRIGDAGFFQNVKNRLAGVLDAIGKLDESGKLDQWAKGLSDGMTWGVDESVNLINKLIGHFKFLTKWATDNPDTFGKIATGVKALAAAIALLKFPRVLGMLGLDDLLSWLEGHPSLIGDFAKQLSELSGIDVGKLEKVLGVLEAAAGAATVAKVGGASLLAGLASLATRLSPFVAMLGLKGDDPNNKYANASPEDRQKMRTRSRNYVDRENAAVEMGDRRRQMEDLMRPPVRAKDIQNTPGIMELFHNIQGNNAKLGAGAVQNVVNDNSDRRVVTNTEVKLTVQQITEAASAAAEAVKGKVSAALSGVNSPSPSRAVPNPSF